MGLGYKSPQFYTLDYGERYRADISYLTIPLSVEYHANKHMSFNGGTYFGFLTGGKDHFNQDASKSFFSNDFGFSLGASHDIYKNFALGMTYFIGAKNISLNEPAGWRQTNRTLQFTVIYKLATPKPKS
jgi:hypothetical protein